MLNSARIRCGHATTDSNVRGQGAAAAVVRQRAGRCLKALAAQEQDILVGTL
jgi:hypothetical protein